MNILLVCDCNLPVSAYDDKARMVWWLGKALFQLGHHVTLMLKDTVVCDFATTLVQNKQKSLNEQIPAHIDLIHFHCDPKTEPDRPYLITYHEVSSGARSFDQNTVFLSDRHAHMHHGSVFVYPGADFESYTPPDLGAKRIWYHFLGDAEKKRSQCSRRYRFNRQGRRAFACSGRHARQLPAGVSNSPEHNCAVSRRIEP